MVQLVGQMMLQLGRGIDVQIALDREQHGILPGHRHLDRQGVLGNRHKYLHRRRRPDPATPDSVFDAPRTDDGRCRRDLWTTGRHDLPARPRPPTS
ncbi:hypothetical protein GCM10010365_18920 [Streptomyces poonensis]|uniref:Uncharacterized protein n=1 Tax=Streptomyces poonensis TaxID=68255 RepID=A0A918UFI7_9ACTN|nr:hypothetical protein GCM10010365_18920 [Streptomyces poonensis]GLJ92120.1 hypothetical protein GCM10017589_47290 [Streptomyces poonensis]